MTSSHGECSSQQAARVVAKWGIGTNNINQEPAEEFVITVSNTPNTFGDVVADVVLGYAIMLTRQLHLVDRGFREGQWTCPRGISLRGKTFGVIGVGDIGTSVARRAFAHEMDVFGSDVRPFPDSLQSDTNIVLV